MRNSEFWLASIKCRKTEFVIQIQSQYFFDFALSSYIECVRECDVSRKVETSKNVWHLTHLLSIMQFCQWTTCVKIVSLLLENYLILIGLTENVFQQRTDHQTANESIFFIGVHQHPSSVELKQDLCQLRYFIFLNISLLQLDWKGTGC